MKWLIIKYFISFWLQPAFRRRSEIEAYQAKKLKVFEKKILKSSPYFSREIKLYGSVKLVSVSDKKVMMSNFDEINTVGIQKKEAFDLAIRAEETRDFAPKINGITVGLSSGTSGNRGIFLVSDEERAKWVAVVIKKLLSPLGLKKRKIAFFLRANSNLYSAIKSNLFEFRFFDLKNNIKINLKSLNQLQPEILVAPPSMLLIIAKSIENKEIAIKPSKIISVAEVLEENDKRFLQTIFNQTIHQAYQCTEGFLASTCSYGTLHFHEDLIRIEKEYLDETKKRFYPIITDFSRFALPVVRYRLNDIIHERKDPCPCGSVFLAIDHIEGRSDDVFEFKNKNAENILIFPDFFRKAVITSSEDIEEYRVEQVQFDFIKVYLKTSSFENNRILVEKSLNQLMHENGVENCKFEFLQEFPLLNDHKLRRIKRNF